MLKRILSVAAGVLRAEATAELVEMIPDYESEPGYLDLHRRIKDLILDNAPMEARPDGAPPRQDGF